MKLTVVALCLGVTAMSNAYVSVNPQRRTFPSLVQSPSETRRSISSRIYQSSEVETESSTTSVNGQASTTATPAGRYDDVLQAVGLDGKLKQVADLPEKRPMSPFNIFCNRELNLGGIGAIGFDMDYTLAQYQQPAFDKLAFDGAKEKLVKKLGYPEEVLDFEYDHEVRSDC